MSTLFLRFDENFIMRSRRVDHSSFDDDENSDDDDDENDETQSKRQNENKTIFKKNKNVVENESFELFREKENQVDECLDKRRRRIE
jgi:hypothetical protein